MNGNMKWGSALCLVATLAGCGQLGKSAEERIGLAMPVSSEAQSAKQALDALAKAQSADAKQMENEYQAKLKVRALECAHGYTPTAMASEEAIRGALTDKACFSKFDEGLVQWIGLRRVGLLLAAPPLRPVPAKPATMLVAEEFVQEANFAARAGIAVLQSGKRYQVMDMADGKVIHSDTRSNGTPVGALSPNGRLLLTAQDRDAVVLEAETGDALARFSTRSLAFFWVGDVGAIFVPEGAREPVFLDFTSGVETKIPFGSSVEQIVQAYDSPLRFALLGFNRVGLIELSPSPQGHVPRLIQETRMTEPAGWSRNTSGLNADGSIFFGARQSLGLLDTRTMQMRTVPFDPLRLHSAVATTDPDRLYLTGYLRDAPGGGIQTVLYSISRRTLAPVPRDQLLSTRVIYIAPLRRNGIIDGSKVSLLEQLPSGAEEEANAYIAQRASAASAVMATRMAELGARRLPPGLAMPRTTQAPVDARLAALASGADIEAVGVYEGSEVGKARGASARTGTVQVRVARSSRPMVLSLSSYEPVRWVITLEPGAKLAAVLQSGYSASEVFGAGSARVYNTGKSYSYKRGGGDYTALSAEVQAWTGKGIDTFQGGYTGNTFRVGGP